MHYVTPFRAFVVIPFIAVLLLGSAAANAALENIIVETRKTEENLQDVPISVRTLSTEQIERQGITGIDGVAKYTPGIEFDEGFGAQDTRIVIRGLSPTRGRSNAAFLVDGIDFTGEAVTTAGSAFAVNQRLLDVERVEVVKGPQSALYGRSAFAGAVQYITKKPNLEEWEADLTADLGTDDQYQVTGAVGLPITETFAIRLNGLWYDEDGFHDNALTGESVGGSDGTGVALSGLWAPSDTFNINGRVAYSEDNYETAAQARVAANTRVDINQSKGSNDLIYGFSPFAFGGGITGNYPDCGNNPDQTGRITSCLGTPKVLTTGTMPDGDSLSVMQSPNPLTGGNYPGTEVDTLTMTLVADWDTDVGTWTSLTGYADTDSKQLFDGDWDVQEGGQFYVPLSTPDFTDAWPGYLLPPCGGGDCARVAQQIDFNTETELFSQEFRYATNLDGPLNFTGGVLYWNEDVDQIEHSATVAPATFRSDGSGAQPPQQILVLGTPTAASILAAADTNIFPNTIGREVEHWSIYGLVDFDFTEQWKFTAEARYVDEELDVSGPLCDAVATQAVVGNAPPGPPNGTQSSDTNGDGILDTCGTSFRGASSLAQVPGINGTQLTGYTNAVVVADTASSDTDYIAPKFTAEWRPADDQMWYASIAKGVKPGGISTIAGGTFFDPENRSFSDEKLWAYEIGGKTTWADNRVLVNGAIFFQDYTDKQVGVTQFDQRIQTDVAAIENAGEAEIWGLELDTQWAINENWLVSGAYTWLDAEYTEFESTTSSSNEVARSLYAGNGGCLEVVDLDPGPANSAACRIDRSGNDIEDVPEHAFVGYGRYLRPLFDSGLELLVDASFIYTSDRYIDENNIKELDSYWIMDTRLGLIGDRWEAILFVDNVFDDDTVKSAIDVGSQVETYKQSQFPPGPTDGVVVSLPDPRVVGVRLSYRFGGN